jgi:hypothetical protein
MQWSAWTLFFYDRHIEMELPQWPVMADTLLALRGGQYKEEARRYTNLSVITVMKGVRISGSANNRT